MEIKYLTWSDLSDNQKEQVTQTYISIRAEEEEKLEEDVDSSGVVNCWFFQDELMPNYLQVEI